MGDSLLSYKLLDFFEIPQQLRADSDVLLKISTLYRWAVEQSGGEDYMQVVTELRALEGNLGVRFRFVGSEKLDRLYQWIRLDDQRRAIEGEMLNYA